MGFECRRCRERKGKPRPGSEKMLGALAANFPRRNYFNCGRGWRFDSCSLDGEAEGLAF